MVDYLKPSLTADAVVLAGVGADMSVLLIRRAREPFKGRWAFPGGFVDPYENPFQACLRELREETGLVLVAVEAIALSLRAKRGRDPRGWTVTAPFLFHLSEPVAVSGSDDAECAEWVPLGELTELAFDHGAVLNEALARFWSGMPTAHERLAGVRPFGMSRPFPAFPVFYGGSFDPWHDGHDACVALFPDSERLVIVPDSNPLKSGKEHRCFWREYVRLHEKETLSGILVFPGFCGLETANPTYSWLSAVKGPVGWLMGEDGLESLPRWLKAEALISLWAELWIVPRQTDPETVETRLRYIKEINPGLVVHRLGDHPFRHMSSSEIRAERS